MNGVLAFVGCVFIVLAIAFFGAFPFVYGLVLAWKASPILFLVALLIEPSPWLIGVIGILGHPEMCQKIATWAGL